MKMNLLQGHLSILFDM